jgi:hypothetical protein
VEEAIEVLLAAYRSVSEREIGVGDHVIFYSVQQAQPSGDTTTGRVDNPDDDDNSPLSPSRKILHRSRIWTAPLKKH